MGWKEGAAHAFHGGRAQDSVWEIPRPRRSETHPTTKPAELVARALAFSSKPGDTVYEPFAGSGTTIVAAEQTGRRCVALEIDPHYAQVAIERWATSPAMSRSGSMSRTAPNRHYALVVSRYQRPRPTAGTRC
jgi:DNA modification methylase